MTKAMGVVSMTNHPIERGNFMMCNQSRVRIRDIHHNIDMERLKNFEQDHDVTKKGMH